MKTYLPLIRPLLFRLPAEGAHHLTLHLLAALGKRRSLQRLLFPPAPRWPVRCFGLTFRNPVGLAAGMDKDALALETWEAVGFGFIEVGTVTRHPQPGNSRPRLHRYPSRQALINRMGFNNAGAEAMATRLETIARGPHWPGIPVGINLGKSKITPNEEAPQDYAESYRLLETFGDYFVVNISSPNTPGLRDLHAIDSLKAILEAIRSVARTTKPLLVKISPDQSEEDLHAVAALAESMQVSGLIATNTTLDHTAIPEPEDHPGGLSGAPLAARSTDVLRSLRKQTSLPLIGSGGIMDASSARDKQQAGAALVQIYTGFVYHGPGLIRDITDAWDRVSPQPTASSRNATRERPAQDCARAG